MESLGVKAYRLRKTVLDMVYTAGTGHIGGDFSVMEILVALYFREMNVSPDTVRSPGRDRFILSKGHCAEALYAVLAERGFISPKQLASYAQAGSPIIGHPTNKIRGIEMNSGSLGHGLALGVGMALGGRMQDLGYRSYVVMGDGELAEGSVWEAAMAASQYRLDTLCAIVDRNRLQISGPTDKVMSTEPLGQRFTAFGWNVLETDGNRIDALLAAFAEAKRLKGMPTLVIANTVKGCGVSFMEDLAVWHHRIPSEEEYHRAKAELELRMVAAG